MITGEQLQIKRKEVLEFSNSLNQRTENLSATDLIKEMNKQRTILINYIELLEQYIGEHEGTWKG